MQARVADAEAQIAEQTELKKELTRIDARRRTAFDRMEVLRGDHARAQAAAQAAAKSLQEIAPVADASSTFVDHSYGFIVRDAWGSLLHCP